MYPIIKTDTEHGYQQKRVLHDTGLSAEDFMSFPSIIIAGRRQISQQQRSPEQRISKIMPITYTIRTDLKLIIIKHSGSVPDEEFLQAYKQLALDKNFDITYDRLIDLRNTDSHVRSAEALGKLAKASEQRHVGTNPAPKTAVLAPKDLSYGLARMYSALSSDTNRELAVFKSVEEVLAWLNIPSDILSD